MIRLFSFLKVLVCILLVTGLNSEFCQAGFFDRFRRKPPAPEVIQQPTAKPAPLRANPPPGTVARNILAGDIDFCDAALMKLSSKENQVLLEGPFDYSKLSMLIEDNLTLFIDSGTQRFAATGKMVSIAKHGNSFSVGFEAIHKSITRNGSSAKRFVPMDWIKKIIVHASIDLTEDRVAKPQKPERRDPSLKMLRHVYAPQEFLQRTSIAEHILPQLEENDSRISQFNIEEGFIPDSFEDMEVMNLFAMKTNHERIRSSLIHKLRELEAKRAIRAIIDESLENHFFEGIFQAYKTGNYTKEHALQENKTLQKNPLRYLNGYLITFQDLVPPAPEDVSEILDKYYHELDELCSEATHLIMNLRHDNNHDIFEQMRIVYTVAAWARRYFTGLQPLVDGNTRVGREIFNWVVARIETLASIQLPNVDLNREEISNLEGLYPVLSNDLSPNDSATLLKKVKPFSANDDFDFKADLIFQILRKLDRYSIAQNKPYFLLTIEGEQLNSQLRNKNPLRRLVTPAQLGASNDKTRASEAHWTTIKDFYLSQLHQLDIFKILNDAPSSNDAALLISYLRSLE